MLFGCAKTDLHRFSKLDLLSFKKTAVQDQSWFLLVDSVSGIFNSRWNDNSAGERYAVSIVERAIRPLCSLWSLQFLRRVDGDHNGALLGVADLLQR
jgi:hypothetical protein